METKYSHQSIISGILWSLIARVANGIIDFRAIGSIESEFLPLLILKLEPLFLRS